MKVYRVELITCAHIAALDAETAEKLALENHSKIIEEFGIAVYKTAEVPAAKVLTDEGYTVFDKLPKVH